MREIFPGSGNLESKTGVFKLAVIPVFAENNGYGSKLILPIGKGREQILVFFCVYFIIISLNGSAVIIENALFGFDFIFGFGKVTCKIRFFDNFKSFAVDLICVAVIFAAAMRITRKIFLFLLICFCLF